MSRNNQTGETPGRARGPTRSRARPHQARRAEEGITFQANPREASERLEGLLSQLLGLRPDDPDVAFLVAQRREFLDRLAAANYDLVSMERGPNPTSSEGLAITSREARVREPCGIYA